MYQAAWDIKNVLLFVSCIRKHREEIMGYDGKDRKTPYEISRPSYGALTILGASSGLR